MTLYVSKNGDVACAKSPEHGGPELYAALIKHPTSVRIDGELEWLLLPNVVAEELNVTCDWCDGKRPNPLPMGVRKAEG